MTAQYLLPVATDLMPAVIITFPVTMYRFQPNYNTDEVVLSVHRSVEALWHYHHMLTRTINALARELSLNIIFLDFFSSTKKTCMFEVVEFSQTCTFFLNV